MDLIKLHYVSVVIDMLNHIKQSFNFFPQTCGAQSFSLVILHANYLYFSLPDVKQACVKSCSVYIYVFLCYSLSYVCSNSMSITSYCPKAIFLHNNKPVLIFFSCLPFSGTSWKLISPSGIPLHHYKSKSHIWFQYVASVIPPQGTAIGNIVFIMAHFVFTSVLWLCLWLVK